MKRAMSTVKNIAATVMTLAVVFGFADFKPVTANAAQAAVPATASVEEENGEKKAPGTVLQADAKGFRIQTGEGILKIDTLQLEGKKRMDAQAFLRGYTVEAGTVLPC